MALSSFFVSRVSPGFIPVTSCANKFDIYTKPSYLMSVISSALSSMVLSAVAMAIERKSLKIKISQFRVENRLNSILKLRCFGKSDSKDEVSYNPT